jgi:hypothetical protein
VTVPGTTAPSRPKIRVGRRPVSPRLPPAANSAAARNLYTIGYGGMIYRMDFSGTRLDEFRME